MIVYSIDRQEVDTMAKPVFDMIAIYRLLEILGGEWTGGHGVLPYKWTQRMKIQLLEVIR